MPTQIDVSGLIYELRTLAEMQLTITDEELTEIAINYGYNIGPGENQVTQERFDYVLGLMHSSFKSNRAWIEGREYIAPSTIYALPGEIAASWRLPHLIEYTLQHVGYNIHSEEMASKATEDGAIVIRTHYYKYIDGESSVSIESVWYNNEPVGIARDSGREEDGDYFIITDVAKYWAMIRYLRNIETEIEEFLNRIQYPDIHPDSESFTILEFGGGRIPRNDLH